MVTDKYWESPNYDPSKYALVPTGQGRSTETPYGISKHSSQARQLQNYTPTPDLSYMFAQNGSGNTGGTLQSFASTLMNPQFSWNAKSGLQGWGKGLGKWATGLGGLYYGLNAAQGLKNYSNSKADVEELMSDIVSASYNNPMLMYDLDSEQQKLLRQLRRGTYSHEVDTDEMDLMGILGGAATGGVTGLVGGIPGAIIGALGGGANAYIDEMNRVQGLSTAELEALYEAVLASEQQNNAMKKQQMLQSGLYY